MSKALPMVTKARMSICLLPSWLTVWILGLRPECSEMLGQLARTEKRLAGMRLTDQ